MSRSQRDWRRDPPGRAPLGNTARTVAPPPIDSPPAFRARGRGDSSFVRVETNMPEIPPPRRAGRSLYYCTHTLARGSFNVKLVYVELPRSQVSSSVEFRPGILSMTQNAGRRFGKFNSGDFFGCTC